MTLDNFLIDGPADARRTFVFAHGAGGPMDGAFMNTVARGLAGRGIRVVRFEFPYMRARRTGGKRGAPDREPVLTGTWRSVIEELGDPERLFIGGKSLGGRMASLVADDCGVAGLICFGYPFHPPGNPEKLRTGHLAGLKTPALIVQGSRDPFGTREEVEGYSLSPAIRVEWLPDGDHSFKPRASAGVTEKENVARAVDLAAQFISNVN
jgi:uncharacterized protein